jgi:hypothetical protein
MSLTLTNIIELVVVVAILIAVAPFFMKRR